MKNVPKEKARETESPRLSGGSGMGRRLAPPKASCGSECRTRMVWAPRGSPDGSRIVSGVAASATEPRAGEARAVFVVRRRRSHFFLSNPRGKAMKMLSFDFSAAECRHQKKEDAAHTVGGVRSGLVLNAAASATIPSRRPVARRICRGRLS